MEGTASGAILWAPAFDYALHAKLKAHSPEMRSEDLSANFPAVPKGYTLPSSDMDAEISLTPAKTSITGAKLTAAGMTASLVGDMARDPVSFAGIARIDIRDMKALSSVAPVLKPYKLKGKAGAKLNIVYGKKLGLSGKTTFNGVAAELAGNELSALKGTVFVSQKQIKSRYVRGRVNGAELKVYFSASNYLTRPKILLNLEQAPVTIAAIPEAAVAQSTGNVKPTLPSQKNPFSIDLRGTTKLLGVTYPELNSKEGTFKYDLKGVSSDPKTLSGKASFVINGGKLDNVCGLAEKHKVSKVVLYPMATMALASRTIKGVKLPDFHTIVFDKMEGNYLFENGVMKLQKSSLDAEQADVEASGSINLATEEIDMKVSIKLKKASGISMSVPLAMKIKGTFDAPEAKVDMKSVMKQPAVKKGLKKLKEEGSKLLDKLFKKK